MRNLLTQWVHLSVDGETCQRCSDTGKNIVQVIGCLKNDSRFKEVDFKFNEMELPPEKIGSSNEIGRRSKSLLPTRQSGRTPADLVPIF
ncbi:MAG: DUF2703 domain-containing protein [Candidatus Paceibacterota bacterium]|jgi:hypothetical protein